jgi:NAD(P)H-flavin reductase
MTATHAHAHRDTIAIEDAEILKHEAFAAHQYVLTLRAPKCAARAEPGSFVHLSCDAHCRSCARTSSAATSKFCTK